jgi:hypothetical protein
MLLAGFAVALGCSHAPSPVVNTFLELGKKPPLQTSHPPEQTASAKPTELPQVDPERSPSRVGARTSEPAATAQVAPPTEQSTPFAPRPQPTSVAMARPVDPAVPDWLDKRPAPSAAPAPLPEQPAPQPTIQPMPAPQPVAPLVAPPPPVQVQSPPVQQIPVRVPASVESVSGADCSVRVRPSVGSPPTVTVGAVQPVIHIGAEPSSWQGGSAPASSSLLSHAPDYVWLVGELQYLQTRHAWRLRYTALGDEDRYGGTVTLTGEPLPAACAGGQIVRVEGRLVNPDSAEARPAYWVNRVEVIKAAPLSSAE